MRQQGVGLRTRLKIIVHNHMADEHLQFENIFTYTECVGKYVGFQLG